MEDGSWWGGGESRLVILEDGGIEGWNKLNVW